MYSLQFISIQYLFINVRA